MEAVANYFREFRSRYFWRAVFMELLATTIFVFMTNSTYTFVKTDRNFMLLMKSGLATGFTAVVLVKIFGPLSGAHFNPAVSYGAYLNSDVTSPRSSVYSGAQYLGGILGAGLTWLLTPAESRSSLGIGSLNTGVTLTQGFFMESLVTFILVLCVLRCNDKRIRVKDGPSSLIIGFAYLAVHLTAFDYTGGLGNPAKAFGPSLVLNYWPDYNWLYWVAPYVGATFAGLLYRFGFKSPENDGSESKMNDQMDVEAQ